MAINCPACGKANPDDSIACKFCPESWNPDDVPQARPSSLRPANWPPAVWFLILAVGALGAWRGLSMVMLLGESGAKNPLKNFVTARVDAATGGPKEPGQPGAPGPLAAAGETSGLEGGMPDLSYHTLAGKEAPTLAACPTPKCLTVYVAPWCPHCRESTPTILALRDFLKDKGVDTRIVVGKDQFPAIKEYAASFGPDTLLDEDSTFPASQGVPALYVSNREGRVLRWSAGMPKPPTIEALAAYYELP